MSEEEKTVELYKTEKELNQIIVDINSIKEKMINFAFALESNPASIGFIDRGAKTNQIKFEFQYAELKDDVFNIEKLERVILRLKGLSERKQQLEEELRIRITSL